MMEAQGMTNSGAVKNKGTRSHACRRWLPNCHADGTGKITMVGDEWTVHGEGVSNCKVGTTSCVRASSDQTARGKELTRNLV